MKVYFAGDHAGFELKKELLAFVRTLGHETEDVGPIVFDPTDDYPDFVIPMAKKVIEAQRSDLGSGERSDLDEVRGIAVAGSGQGEIIAMNRVRGARAALLCPCNLELIKASRDHNDSNILAIGARFCTLEEARSAIKLWLLTPFSNDERHLRRLKKLEELTKR